MNRSRQKRQTHQLRKSNELKKELRKYKDGLGYTRVAGYEADQDG